MEVHHKEGQMPRTAGYVAGTALLITVCAYGLAVPAVHAGHGEHGHGEHKAKDPGACAAKLTEELGLSEEQGAQVTAIIEEYHANVQGTKDQITALWEQMKPLKEQVREQKQVKHDAIKAVLTLEQQVTFAEMKSQKRGHTKHGAGCSCASCALKGAKSSDE